MATPLALFDSWGGHFSDNPRAVSEALRRRDPSVRQCWVLADGVQGPAWADRVAPGSDTHVSVLERARFVVANNLMPRFSKSPGTTVVQTWHGTPLKRIGFDIPVDGDPDHQRYLDHLAHERSSWDLLVSPSPAATPRLRSGFRYEGRVLETGYPRNDILLAPGERARARHELGFDSAARVVLYAPTFREAGDFDLTLDPGALADRLGPDAHVLLRLHHFAPSAPAPHRPHPRVRDVTHAPDDVRDLLLAADALVTDYSSVMTDFAVTGLPIVLFADDLDHYRDERHGFYVDLERIAPGPIVTSTEAVAAALGAAGRSGNRYEAFARTYCALEDGGAADRVVDAMLSTP